MLPALSGALFSGTLLLVERELVESKALVSIGYDACDRVLEVEFRGARLYQYFDVPPAVFDWLMRTPDKTAYLRRMVQPSYRYRALCVPSPESALELEEALRRSLRQPAGASET